MSQDTIFTRCTICRVGGLCTLCGDGIIAQFDVDGRYDAEGAVGTKAGPLTKPHLREL